MITQQRDDIAAIAASGRDHTGDRLLANMHQKLLIFRHEMSDLAEWHRSQSASQPIPSDLLQASQQAMDELSEEAARLCEHMVEIEASTLADLKHKASALEYLLPEDAEHHVILCRSMCTDIHRQ